MRLRERSCTSDGRCTRPRCRIQSEEWVAALCAHRAERDWIHVKTQLSARTQRRHEYEDQGSDFLGEHADRSADHQTLPKLRRRPTFRRILHRSGDRLVPCQAGRYMAAQIQAAKFVELPGDDHIAWIGDTEPLMAEVREFLTGERPALEAVRVLATVLFIDIVQSTSRLASQMDDDRCADQLDLHWFSQRLWFPRNMRLHSLRKRRCSLWHPLLEQLRVLAKVRFAPGPDVPGSQFLTHLSHGSRRSRGACQPAVDLVAKHVKIDWLSK
jgi:hypothetical protein